MRSSSLCFQNMKMWLWDVRYRKRNMSKEMWYTKTWGSYLAMPEGACMSTVQHRAQVCIKYPTKTCPGYICTDANPDLDAGLIASCFPEQGSIFFDRNSSSTWGTYGQEGNLPFLKNLNKTFKENRWKKTEWKSLFSIGHYPSHVHFRVHEKFVCQIWHNYIVIFEEKDQKGNPKKTSAPVKYTKGARANLNVSWWVLRHT